MATQIVRVLFYLHNRALVSEMESMKATNILARYKKFEDIERLEMINYLTEYENKMLGKQY